MIYAAIAATLCSVFLYVKSKKSGGEILSYEVNIIVWVAVFFLYFLADILADDRKKLSFICPKCQSVFPYKWKKIDRLCRQCNVALEPLSGFYQRHPELAEVPKKRPNPLRGFMVFFVNLMKNHVYFRIYIYVSFFVLIAISILSAVTLMMIWFDVLIVPDHLRILILLFTTALSVLSFPAIIGYRFINKLINDPEALESL